jgi:hypothetical protein
MSALLLALSLAFTAPPDSLPGRGGRTALHGVAGVHHARTPRQSTGDAWFAPDKLQHFTLSYGVTAFAFAGAQLVGAEGDTRLRIAAGTGLLAGIAKEIADVSRGAPFSVKDLLYDALGVATAVAILRKVR